MNPSPNANSSPSEAVLEAWNAWQERLDKLNLTSDQREQATAVLIKLMKLRAERQESE
jgi:hypothetical protein